VPPAAQRGSVSQSRRQRSRSSAESVSHRRSRFRPAAAQGEQRPASSLGSARVGIFRGSRASCAARASLVPRRSSRAARPRPFGATARGVTAVESLESFLRTHRSNRHAALAAPKASPPSYRAVAAPALWWFGDRDPVYATIGCFQALPTDVWCCLVSDPKHKHNQPEVIWRNASAIRVARLSRCLAAKLVARVTLRVKTAPTVTNTARSAATH